MSPSEPILYSIFSWPCFCGPVIKNSSFYFPGSSLFSDFHCLSRIWCHPWSLHLERLRRLARQKSPDSMEEFLDDNEESSASESEGTLPNLC